jgi:hypothetical protein
MKFVWQVVLLLLVGSMQMSGQVPEKKIASGVTVKIIEQQKEIQVRYGLDIYGANLFSLHIMENGGRREIHPSEDIIKKIRKLLDAIKVQRYTLTETSAVWAFDGVLVDIEIVQGVRKLHYIDLIDECMCKGKMHQLRKIVRELAN